MKVLMSAYACEPGAGSEPGAGWAWARAAALDHEVWVLTRANNAPAISEALAEERELRLRPIYVDLPAWARLWKRGQRGVHLYYLLWQRLARRTARRLHQQERFDVAHHLTFAVDWMPAGVVGLPGLPAVWGPVGGSTGTPWGLWRWLGWRGVVSEALREATTRPMRRLVGDRTARQAELTIAQNLDVEARFRSSGRVLTEPHPALDVESLLDNVGTSHGFSEAGHRRSAVFVGRLIPWKGLRLAIAAIAEPQAHLWELHVYGEGRELAPGRRLAARLGVEHRVQFHGHQPRTQVLDALATADTLLFLSMHESAGWAVAEAVSLGAQVICLDRGGPPLLAPDGIKVAAAGARTAKLIASALAAAPARGNPDTRWSSDRLPGLLSTWYTEATARTAAAAAGTP